MTLREQIFHAMMLDMGGSPPTRAVDAVVELVAERERVLRDRIEALPKYSMDAREWRRMVCLTDVLEVFDDES